MLALNCVAICTWPYVQDLFHELDSRLPRGDYRIPSLVATTNGTLLAFVNGRFHRTDQTPDILYMRRSLDDGNTWEPAQAVLADPTNRALSLAARQWWTRPLATSCCSSSGGVAAARAAGSG